MSGDRREAIHPLCGAAKLGRAAGPPAGYLTDCIGCGCLSLTSCRLQNRDDELARAGDGARLLLPGG